LVEDEWLLADILEETVREMGFNVSGPVPTVPQALTLLDGDLIGSAILDVSLGPSQKSYPIARILMERRIPFLFVSGYHEKDLPSEFRAIPLCSKPYDGDVLRSHLQKLLGKDFPRKATH
jgi:DNA-binding response OmpR family regulator